MRLVVDESGLGRVAAALAPQLTGGGVVFLEGDLGAGKTTFARALLRALGERGPVKSPTYTLVEPYQLETLAVYHFDLYRLADPAEMEYLGARDYFVAGALCLVEWPQRAETWLSAPDLRIALRVHGAARELLLTSCSTRAETWLKALALFM